MQLSNNSIYYQIKIFKKKQSSGFLDVFKFLVTCITVFHFSNAKMSQKRKCQNLTIQTKAESLQKHLYQKIKVNGLAAKYDIPANTISTWKNMLINI